MSDSERELPDEPGVWFRESDGRIEHWWIASGSGVTNMGEPVWALRLDDMRCSADFRPIAIHELPRGGWSKAIPASELAKIKEQLDAVTRERDYARDLLTFEHTGELGMKSLMQNEIDQLRTQLAACEGARREAEENLKRQGIRLSKEIRERQEIEAKYIAATQAKAELAAKVEGLELQVAQWRHVAKCLNTQGS